ncbi:MAG: PEP-CTERM sorting domain-containing protein [Proteobacteria bacterium]|nr:PEP-CTERM sorting domain-containing protein [Pseudomonadota bacterium]
MDTVFQDNSGSLKLTVTGSSVPLPSAFWLLGSGLLGIIRLKRKIS